MSSGFLSTLGIDVPVIAAPMAGGPGSLDLVAAAARAGSLGFVAAGYKTPQEFAEQIASAAASGNPFGANLFVPRPVPVDRSAYRHYAERIAVEAARYGVAVDVAAPPVEDDDGWAAKLDVLHAYPVPVLSFTFGLPSHQELAMVRGTGAVLLQTVTTVEEARAAAAAGLDGLVVQSSAAGGHSGTFTPTRPLADVPIADLVAQIRHTVDLPVIAAGGLAMPEAVAAVIRAGADAVAVGTALLRSHEAGTSATHKAALSDPNRTGTVVTHAFTGRPARALRNEFTDRYSGIAPYGYPALHHLTSAMRKAAAAAGDPERVHLWAGTGYRHATEDHVAEILGRLVADL